MVRYYVDYYLSISQLDKSCEIFEVTDLINDDYLTNFKIYCLLHKNKKEEAQLLFDLKFELESLDNYCYFHFFVLCSL